MHTSPSGPAGSHLLLTRQLVSPMIVMPVETLVAAPHAKVADLLTVMTLGTSAAVDEYQMHPARPDLRPADPVATDLPVHRLLPLNAAAWVTLRADSNPQALWRCLAYLPATVAESDRTVAALRGHPVGAVWQSSGIAADWSARNSGSTPPGVPH